MQISRQAQVWRAVHRELQTYTVGRAWVTLTLEEQRRHPLAPHRRPPRILTKGMAIATDTAELCAASVCAPSTILGTILSTIYHIIYRVQYNRCVQYDKRNMDVLVYKATNQCKLHVHGRACIAWQAWRGGECPFERAQSLPFYYY